MARTFFPDEVDLVPDRVPIPALCISGNQGLHRCQVIPDCHGMDGYLQLHQLSETEEI